MKPASSSLRRAQPHLGTLVEIQAAGAPGLDLQGAIDRGFAAIARVHRLMSFHDTTSDVGRINRAAPGDVVAVDPWTHQVLVCADEMRIQSGGAFDIAADTAFGARGTLSLLPERSVRIADAPVRIDLGGIAKGFAVDRALDALDAAGAASALVNAGGDLAVRGRAARVHVRDPRAPGRALCALDLADQAIASSGGRLEGRSGTVLDPRTRVPVGGAVGATVRASSCLLADALTKVVMLLGERAAPLLARHHAAALLVRANGDALATSDWPALQPAAA